HANGFACHRGIDDVMQINWIILNWTLADRILILMDIHSFLRFIYGQRGIFLSKIWTPTDKTNQIILDKTQFKFTIRTMSIERSPDNNLKLAKLDHKHRTSVATTTKKEKPTQLF